MPYIWGVLTGVLLTILVVFLIDHVDDRDGRDIVNWDYLDAKVGASVEQAGEKVRQEVHEATAPEPDTTPPPATEPAPAPAQ